MDQWPDDSIRTISVDTNSAQSHCRLRESMPFRGAKGHTVAAEHRFATKYAIRI